jgi:aminoglycoside phosphotransferase (APT) family kinase protein
VTVYGTLGDLSDAQLQAALDRFALGRLVAARAFTEGLFGKNVGITTDRGRWVLRGHPWPAGCTEQFDRERFFADAIRSACDVPVPWPFHIEADESLFGWPYQLTPWMPGEQQRDAGGAAALGRAAASLRAVTFPHVGAWSPATNGIEPFDGTAAEWLAFRTRELLHTTVLDTPPLAASDVNLFESLLPDIVDCTPTYVHHDLKVGNAVCLDGELSGLFDLGEGIVADPLEDLARATWDLARSDPSWAATFLRAYEAASGVVVPRDVLRRYVVFDLLVIWQYGRRPSVDWYTEPTFEVWSRTLCSGVDRALEMLADRP